MLVVVGVSGGGLLAATVWDVQPDNLGRLPIMLVIERHDTLAYLRVGVTDGDVH